ncbi:MAG: hypothetical protein ACO1OQ_05565 [Rufibacter sp.]
MVWRCDKSGKVLEVVKTDFPALLADITGQPFSCLLPTHLRESAEEWFQNLSSSSQLLPNLFLQGILKSVTFTLGGTVAGQEYWLFWTTAKAIAPSVLGQQEGEENARQAQTWEPDQQHIELLEELSRVNNELVNARRELIRQNIELHRAHQKLNNAAS